MNLPETKRGFTLIEILIVLIIISVLVTFIVASFTRVQAKSRDAKRKTDLDTVKKALELVKNDCLSAGFYPRMNFSGAPAYALLISYLADADLRYMKDSPNDPNGAPAGYEYYVESTLTPNACPSDTGAPLSILGSQNYMLRATLENVNDPAGSESHSKCTGRPQVPGAYPGGGAYYVCND